MVITAIREFPDGHFEVDITFATGLHKTIGIPASPKGADKKVYLTAQLQAIKTAANETGPTDITSTIGPIVLV